MPTVELYTREPILTSVLTNDEIAARIRSNKWVTFESRVLESTGRTKFEFTIDYTADSGQKDEIEITVGLPLPTGFLEPIGNFIADYFGAELMRWNRVVEASKVIEDFPKTARTLFESVGSNYPASEGLVDESPADIGWFSPWAEAFEGGKTYNFPGPNGVVIFTIYDNDKVTLRVAEHDQCIKAKAQDMCKQILGKYTPAEGLKLPREYGAEEVELTAEEFIELHVAKDHPDMLCLGAGKLFAYYRLPMVF